METKIKQIKRAQEIINDATYLTNAIVEDDNESITQWLRFLENTIQLLKYDLGIIEQD